MKPSERILKITNYYNGNADWIVNNAIIAYLDEEYEKIQKDKVAGISKDVEQLEIVVDTTKLDKNKAPPKYWWDEFNELHLAAIKKIETRPFLLKLINERKNVKMRVLPQLSKEIQEWCFAHGLGWRTRDVDVCYFDMPFLYICCSIQDNHYCLMHRGYDESEQFMGDDDLEYDVLNDCEMKEKNVMKKKETFEKVNIAELLKSFPQTIIICTLCGKDVSKDPNYECIACIKRFTVSKEIK